jgi:GntR family transcriptional regulator
LERRIRISVADGVLQPGDPLPAVRQIARRRGLAPNTVSRAYADLAREGVIVTRAGAGSAIAPSDSLDREALRRAREEALRVLARQVAVRALALGLEAQEILAAVRDELAAHGRVLDDAEPSRPPLGDAEAPLLSTRNRLRGRVKSLREGEIVAEVGIALHADSELVAAITRASIARLGLAEGGAVSAYVKATEIVLGR